MKLLPSYTGLTSIDKVLQSPRALRLLWLEILVNEHLDFTPWQTRSEVKNAYKKVYQWHTTYQRLIESMIPRTPLPVDHTPIDFRDYRTFAEALRFATTLAS
ncbi:MAG: hypothetical protein NPIRA02_05240 [Nitrospirales bacterium]|nr:MAG: hypothetical protein NPIRA02_05240 [Nitrospirales bacterium]